MRRLLSQLVLIALCGAPLFAQEVSPAPIPMPADRTSDSYRIYSSLIPLGETAGKGWSHEVWLVRATYRHSSCFRSAVRSFSRRICPF
jgi:hypothetical protein